MNKYNDIEIQTAKNLLKKGYKWLVRETCGDLYVYKDKPYKNYDRDTSDDTWQYYEYDQICTIQVPIFESINFGDEPVSLESIVHPQILDNAEHQYLSAVIRPFRDKVNFIEKCGFASAQPTSKLFQECIVIHYKSGGKTFLPYFDMETMYKGMERNKLYTLEELGL